jgi:PPOX class probable F420-dependent enzyme
MRLAEARTVRTIGLLGGHAPDRIPASHRDLVECPPVAALTTVVPDGCPQTSVVWCDLDGEYVRVNTMLGCAKQRNMRRDPRVTLLCYDPRQPLRYLKVRGKVVEMTQRGRGRAPGQPRLQVRRPADPLLRRRHPGALRRDRGAGPVPHPANSRRRARREREGGKGVTVPISASHLDLLTRPICGVLTTVGGDGQPQSSLVWVDWDGACARVNTTLERQKGHSLLANPKVSLLVICRIHARRVTVDAIHP